MTYQKPSPMELSPEQIASLRQRLASCTLAHEEISSLIAEAPFGSTPRKTHRKTSDYRTLCLGEYND